MKWPRLLAERLSHRVVFRRRLPSHFGGGKIFVSPDAGLRHCRPKLAEADPLLFRMVDELVRPGDVVWDVGANVGLFTFAAANRAGSAGQVVAVEADLWLVSLLRRSAERIAAADAKVTVIPAAVSNSVELAKFHIAKRARSANYLEGAGTVEAGGTRATEYVVTISLDWLLERMPVPNVLKIDVEGLEHRVLAGATRLLSAGVARIWCEVSPTNAEAVAGIFRTAGYEMFYANVDAAKRQPLKRAPFDTLALPVQRTR
jgi:FkbM family methyltransferase